MANSVFAIVKKTLCCLIHSGDIEPKLILKELILEIHDLRQNHFVRVDWLRNENSLFSTIYMTCEAVNEKLAREIPVQKTFRAKECL